MSFSNTKSHSQLAQPKEKQEKTRKQPSKKNSLKQSPNKPGRIQSKGKPLKLGPGGSFGKSDKEEATFTPSAIFPDHASNRAKVEALIRQACEGEALSPEEVKAMTYSLEQFSRLCYHLVFSGREL